MIRLCYFPAEKKEIAQRAATLEERLKALEESNAALKFTPDEESPKGSAVYRRSYLDRYVNFLVFAS